jgi:hypothetical protein
MRIQNIMKLSAAELVQGEKGAFEWKWKSLASRWMAPASSERFGDSLSCLPGAGDHQHWKPLRCDGHNSAQGSRSIHGVYPCFVHGARLLQIRGEAFGARKTRERIARLRSLFEIAPVKGDRSARCAETVIHGIRRRRPNARAHEAVGCWSTSPNTSQLRLDRFDN